MKKDRSRGQEVRSNSANNQSLAHPEIGLDACLSKLEDSMLEMQALLEINNNLHHYARWDEGRHLGDHALAGWMSITHEVSQKVDAHLKQCQAAYRSGLARELN